MIPDLRCKLLVALVLSAGFAFQWWLLGALH